MVGVKQIIFSENDLTYENYFRLRESVGWKNFSRVQAENALGNSLYTVTVLQNNQAVAMGRLIGDGMYYTMVDVVVQPEYQRMGIGGKIVNMLLDYVLRKTPDGGRSSIQLTAEKGKESFYEKMGFKTIPHEFCGSGMRKVIYK